MLAEITGALGALKEAATLLQTVQQMKADNELAAKTQELRTIITSAQQSLIDIQTNYSAALRRIDELENELMQQINWTAEKQRYELHQKATGAFVYRIKENMRGNEPIHEICPQCYENGIKSILQFFGMEKGFHILSCFQCGNKVLAEKAGGNIAAVQTYSECPY